VFLGTPHRGSDFAAWGSIASNLAKLTLQDSNKNIVETLKVNGEVFDNIQEEFQRIVLEDRIIIHSFQEAKGVSGIKGLSGKVALKSLLFNTPVVNVSASGGRRLLVQDWPWPPL
jgi:hypothetical protein